MLIRFLILLLALKATQTHAENSGTQKIEFRVPIIANNRFAGRVSIHLWVKTSCPSDFTKSFPKILDRFITETVGFSYLFWPLPGGESFEKGMQERYRSILSEVLPKSCKSELYCQQFLIFSVE